MLSRLTQNKIKGAIKVERLERILIMLDHSLNTKKKRHIAGGILMSISLLFGGLAVTVISLRPDENDADVEEANQVYLE